MEAQIAGRGTYSAFLADHGHLTALEPSTVNSEVLRERLKDHPSAERYFLLGEAYSKDGKKAQAKTDYETACKHGYAPACGK